MEDDFVRVLKKNANNSGKIFSLFLMYLSHYRFTLMANTEGDFIFLQTSSRVFTKVSKETYSLISGLILSSLDQKPRLTIIELIEEIGTQTKNFKGNLPWYVLHIKADLRIKKVNPVSDRNWYRQRNQFIQKCRINRFNRFEMKWLLKFKNDLRHS